MLEEVVGLRRRRAGRGERRRPRPRARPRTLDDGRAPRRAASRCSTCSARGVPAGSTCSSTGACSIPRPETEVGRAGRDRRGRRGSASGVGRADPWARRDHAYAVADLGTGSGALALALASALPDAEVWATDVERRRARGRAGQRRRCRARRARVSGSRRARGSPRCPTTLRGPLLLVVSNPPYVAEHEVADCPPRSPTGSRATRSSSGPTGLEAIEHDRRATRRSGSTRRRRARPRARAAPGRARSRELARDGGLRRVAVAPGPHRPRSGARRARDRTG